MACIHSHVPGCETELLSRPSAIDTAWPANLQFHSGSCTQSPRDSLSSYPNFWKVPPHKITDPRWQAIIPRLNCGHVSFWSNDYYCATTTSQGLCSSAPGDMDHECMDIEMMDLDDPMEVTTSPLSSSFILDYTLRPIPNWAPLFTRSSGI
jgi:hypothetical protein